ncbi:Adenine phosphoribosyltransferase [Pleurostoma richardsiae]|uniref:adenine phosphoribosyltransferase n=1 Tax=Pleurostoma richardsiae TaxID=41990 RepID=A0AA38VV23_9PEZI|nr:Adenine phosphoribosyltransferase [Pleurostoma richardsiae]
MTSTSEPDPNLAASLDQPSATAAAQLSSDHASGREPSAASPSPSELARTKISLYNALRRFPDFPIPGINFIDIMPWFLDPAIHATLLRSLELQIQQFGGVDKAIKPDVVVGLDARGFLFGPSLALRLGASFVPVRKRGKLPGPCVTAEYEKEYGADYFQMQEGSIKPGQKVLVVDDIIATGGSAAAAGELVKQLGGNLIGYLFIVEIPFLKGRDKLGDVPVVTLLEEA